MPFDGKDFPLVTVPFAKAFDFDLATPDERLLELARLLENEQEWRDSRMAWDFSEVLDHTHAEPDCGTAGCAIGLAALCFPRFIREEHHVGIYDLSEAWRAWGSAEIHFAMRPHAMENIFGATRAHMHGGFDATLPIHVATAIREFVSTRQASS